MDEVDPHPTSRSRLIRDLAVRGAEAERATRDRERASEAREYLLGIASGEIDFDFAAVAAIHAAREAEADPG